MRLAKAMEYMGMMWACDECGFRNPSWFAGYEDAFHNKRFCNKSCCEKNLEKRKENKQ